MKNIYLLIVFLISCFKITAQNTQVDYSQNTKSYTLATPEVSSFERYSLNNVDYYTGKVGVSIPIYTIKTGSIEYPINMVYNTNGIKVDQLSSEVGLGWNITSALITRTVNSSNDFDNSGYISGQSDYNTYSTDDKNYDQQVANKKIGYFLRKESESQSFGGYTIFQYSDVDFLPDMYHFFANGSKTDFFFSDMSTPVELNPKGTLISAIPSKVRIDTKKGNYNGAVWQPLYNLLTQDFFTITITTNEGIKYTFADCDFSIIQAPNGVYKVDSPAQISAWHITKIEDLKTGKKIDFIYDITSSNPNHPAGSTAAFDAAKSQRSYGYSTNNTPQNPGYLFYNTDLQAPSARVDIQKKRLKKIVFDEGEINFNYNNAGVTTAFIRNDVYNSDCLTQIYIKNQKLATVKSYNFSYGYFSSNYNVGEFNPDFTTNTMRYNRLKLLSFGEVGKPVHKFTYEESIKLPAVNSFSIDFLGYFNNSPDTQCCNYDRIPTLYYYQNQFEKSLLPFPIPGMTPTSTISGYFNREANEYAKAWSLIKMEYPTGGSSEYVYESNQFEEFGQNIKGGGVRVAQQKLNDGIGGTRNINYTYTKTTGNSSGKLSSMPYFGFPLDGAFNYEMTYPADELTPAILTQYYDNTNILWQLYDKSNLNADITSGAYVGYSRVTEREVGNGRKEFTFTSNDTPGFQNVLYRIPPMHIDPQYPQLYFDDLLWIKDINGNPTLDQGGNPQHIVDDSANWAIGNSALFSNFFTDNSYKRGKLLENSIYNEANQLVEKTAFTYIENLWDTMVYHQGFGHITNNPVYISPYSQDYYNHYLRVNMEAFITVRKEYKIAQFLPATKTVSSFDSLGAQNDLTTSFTYNGDGLVKIKQTTVSGGDYNKIIYYYPPEHTMINEPYVYELKDINCVGVPLRTVKYRNTEVVSDNKTVYSKDASTSNLLLPKYIYTKKGNVAANPLEKQMTFDLYDDKGNLLQYTLANGVPVSLIWGYNKTLPIARIENMAYASITPTTLITNAQTESNTGTETTLLSALTTLRNSSIFTDSLITTYTHVPLTGISTVTDNKGYIVYYTYDSFGRLINIKDAAGKLVKENQYNYKPQI
jgi:YD repeat-containing protein